MAPADQLEGVRPPCAHEGSCSVKKTCRLHAVLISTVLCLIVVSCQVATTSTAPSPTLRPTVNTTSSLHPGTISPTLTVLRPTSTAEPSPTPLALSELGSDNILHLASVATIKYRPMADALKLAWSPDSKTIFAAYKNGAIVTIDVPSLQRGLSLIMPNDIYGYSQNAVAISPSAGLVALSLFDQPRAASSLAVLNIKTQDIISKTQAPIRDFDVAWDHQGNLLATYQSYGTPKGSENYAVWIWTASTAQILYKLVGSTDRTDVLAFSPDDTLLATGSIDNRLIVWDMSTGKPSAPPFSGHIADVTAIAWDPKGAWLASGSRDATVRIWDYRNGKTLKVLTPHQWWIDHLAVSQDGSRAAASGEFGNVNVWDTQSWQLQCGVPVEQWDPLSELAWSPNSQLLLATDRRNSLVRIWDGAQCAQVQQLEAYYGEWSPDGTMIAAFGAEGIHVYGVRQ